MNYLHAFHAGNFADLQKHAVLLGLLAALRDRGRGIRLVDTHAGAGLYDLADAPAQRSGEAAAGIQRLFDAGECGDTQLAALLQMVRTLNPAGLRYYPGSPLLAAMALQAGDRLTACELRAEEAERLAANMKLHAPLQGPEVLVRAVDGFSYAAALAPDPARSTLVLIDPPYERGDDHDRVYDTVLRMLGRDPDVVVAIWLPIKDLETLDFLFRRLETIPGLRGYAAQLRLRPLINPMRMNGCAMIVLGADETRDAAQRTTGQLVELCSDEPGRRAQLDSLGA
jgi:23S rRNA (adenine2030-N6)-methyltransferase